MIETLAEAEKRVGTAAETLRYVLMTAAYNEEAFIARTIESVVAQTMLPARWIIASDGSTDRTDEIVSSFAGRYAFIQLLRVERSHLRGVISKINALSLAYKQLEQVKHDFVGNLDADVSLPDTYFEQLITFFRSDSRLGICGGSICEERHGVFRPRPTNRLSSVAHAAQLVRRECYEAVGGYRPLKYGGEDWCAEVSARMMGWSVRTLPQINVLHYRPTGGADRRMLHYYRQGKMDFTLGSHPLFELMKCARRISERPWGLAAAARLAGFLWSYTTREPRLVTQEFVTFLRAEQRNRLNPFG